MNNTKPVAYRFTGAVIRLTDTDYAAWCRRFPDLNLPSELMQRDAWLARQDDRVRKRWYYTTSVYLENQQTRAMNRRNLRDAQRRMAERYA